MNHKIFKTTIILAAIVILTIGLSIIFFQFKFVFVNDTDEIIIGIIDDSLSFAHGNVVMSNKTLTEIDEIKSHGDNMLEFLIAYAPNVKVYYYDATNEEGVINTGNMILAFEWLMKQDVSIIVAGLSSNYYSEELKNYLQENQNNFYVYASYNNLEQSIDYPAMYPTVIGCGKTRSTAKSNDMLYRTSKIILLSMKPKLYNGNSFLSLMAAIS